ncbi:MAG TPA: hypothetical protein VFK59_07930 [Actinomycetota bacterium]|nr:hypothetical protein [Actinomycetota bacterium]
MDAKKTMFFVNAKARVGNGPRRVTRELDFLVYDSDRLENLEVDGPWHEPATAWKDHERDRLFRLHGPSLRTERYDANRCYEEPEAVVAEFLSLMRGPR